MVREEQERKLGERWRTTRRKEEKEDGIVNRLYNISGSNAGKDDGALESSATSSP